MERKRVAGGFLIFVGFVLLIIGLIRWLGVVKIDNKIITTSGFITITPKPTRIPNYSLDEIFRYRDPAQATTSASKKLDEYTIIATGDVIPARSVNSVTTKRNNFRYPYEKTADFLKSSDIVLINLETPLLSDCKVTDEGMKFCGSVRAVEGLKFGGVGIASLANNHAGNYGAAGLEQTESLLNKNGIQTIGLNKPAIIQIKDNKFGFLGFNDIDKQKGLGMSLADENFATEVAQLKKNTDFIIVAFHWGVEYTNSPSVRQKELAHIAIDNGADLVIGNHPHWVEGIEIYKNKFITYAHGNFIFDQMWSQETREGVVGKYVFDKYGLKDVSFYPVIIENYSQPGFAKEIEAKKILERMKKSSSL